MQHANFLRDVREGMKVFDNTNTEIGTVDWVKFGDDNPGTPEPEASGLSSFDRQPRDTFIDNLAEAFAPDEIP